MADGSAHVLKKGFLVKKRVQKKRWKTYWCVLYEDQLVYYRKKDSTTAAGHMSLHGASVESHVPIYEDRKAVFKLYLQDGREYLWQCPSKEERDIWSLTVSATIRSLDSTTQSRSSVFEATTTVDLSEVLVAMQDPEAGLPLNQYHFQNKDYSNCFAGSSVVDWLIKWHFADSRDSASRLAAMIVSKAHILPLPRRDKKSSDSANDPASNKVVFCDAVDVYYRFTSVCQTGDRPVADIFMDSSSDSAGSSDAEYSEGDVLESDSRATKGSIVKEGFLMKKGYRMRKKRWKVRKVMLRDEPPTLSYYSASKNNVQLLKCISLEGAFVVDMDEYDSRSPDDATSKRACMFYVSIPFGTNKRMLLTFQAEDIYCKKEWLEALQRICRAGNCVVETTDAATESVALSTG
jgi:hypothetical protein